MDVPVGPVAVSEVALDGYGGVMVITTVDVTGALELLEYGALVEGAKVEFGGVDVKFTPVSGDEVENGGAIPVNEVDTDDAVSELASLVDGVEVKFDAVEVPLSVVSGTDVENGGAVPVNEVDGDKVVLKLASPEEVERKSVDVAFSVVSGTEVEKGGDEPVPVPQLDEDELVLFANGGKGS